MRLLQTLSDLVILSLVELWIRVRARGEWRILSLRMRRCKVRQLCIAVPRLGDEKFLWRKLFDHNPDFIPLSDKIAAKEWISARGINVAMPETLWTGTDANDIPDDLWKRPFYLKAAHGYNMNIPVLTEPEDRDAVVAAANAWLGQEHGRDSLQWAYQHVPPRLLAEEALFVGKPLIEVKFYTNGPIVEQFVFTRHGAPTTSARWLRQLDGGYARDSKPTTHGPHIDMLPLPPIVDQALDLASEIGSYFDQMRVDTMTDGETLFLGEITVYNQAGRFHLMGHLPDAPVNRSWDLRRSWFLRTPQRGFWRLYAAALRRALDRREVQGELR